MDGDRILGEIVGYGNRETYRVTYLYDAEGSPIGMLYRKPNMVEGVYYTYWFEKNLQGDIVAVYNENGVKLISYTYDAWGNFTVTTHNTSGNNYYAALNPFHYRGYYFDVETGYYYLNSRYYDPQWGRFINADGYISTGTGMLGYNMFAYCNNNPVMYVDYSGEIIYSIVSITFLLGCILLIPSSEKQVPTKSQIEVAQKAAQTAICTLSKDKNGNNAMNISISLSDENAQFDSIASDYFYSALYEKYMNEAANEGLNVDNSNLMTLSHIRWEYTIHKIGYFTGIKALQSHCDPVDINVDETWFSIFERGWKAIW